MKAIGIDNYPDYYANLNRFFRMNPDIEIVNIISEKPYHITIFYQEHSIKELPFPFRVNGDFKATQK